VGGDGTTGVRTVMLTSRFGCGPVRVYRQIRVTEVVAHTAVVSFR